MTCTDQQIGLLMKHKNKHTIKVAAAKSGMSEKTAHKYLVINKTPSENKKPRTHNTRKDPFAQHTEEIKQLYQNAPELQANTILEHLMEKYPGIYSDGHIWTLRRRLRSLRAEIGKAQDVMFIQNIQPGRQSQSDWTCMNSLGIQIAGQPFPHLLFHFMLPYSRWESVMVCYSESFVTLAQGCERAWWQLGGALPDHRTDNLSAATKTLGAGRTFTERWLELCSHYNIKPSRNNPGVSNENGSVEKSHDLLKKAIDQQLHLRGNRNFDTLESYDLFLNKLVLKRNTCRKERLAQEVDFLKPLPEKKFYAPEVVPVKVNNVGTIRLKGITYSVPSRLIGFSLVAHVTHDQIVLFYGLKKVEELPISHEKEAIDYRHLIDHLLRKPGAFEHYKYKESFFPQLAFKHAYEQLQAECSANQADKLYLKLLSLAKLHGEDSVKAALEILAETSTVPLPERVKDLVDAPSKPVYEGAVLAPDLQSYDVLLSGSWEATTCH